MTARQGSSERPLSLCWKLHSQVNFPGHRPLGRCSASTGWSPWHSPLYNQEWGRPGLCRSRAHGACCGPQSCIQGGCAPSPCHRGLLHLPCTCPAQGAGKEAPHAMLGPSFLCPCHKPLRIPQSCTTEVKGHLSLNPSYRALLRAGTGGLLCPCQY